MLLTPKLCGADEVKSDLGGHYGGHPVEAKPLDESLSNFVCILSGPRPTFLACQIYGKGVKSNNHFHILSPNMTIQ